MTRLLDGLDKTSALLAFCYYRHSTQSRSAPPRRAAPSSIWKSRWCAARINISAFIDLQALGFSNFLSAQTAALDGAIESYNSMLVQAESSAGHLQNLQQRKLSNAFITASTTFHSLDQLFGRLQAAGKQSTLNALRMEYKGIVGALSSQDR